MIIIALDNEYIFEQLSQKHKGLHPYDIQDQEQVIELVAKYEDITIITKDSLPGRLTKEIYIKQIRLANKNARIILLIEKLEDRYKSFLLSHEVFCMIEGEKIDLEKIEQAFNQDKFIYKQEIKEVKPVEIISVFGTSGSGKSYLSYLLSKSQGNHKTLLFDSDFQNAAQDIYHNLSYSQNNLMEIVEDLDNGRDVEMCLENRLIKEKNVSYITANTSIYDYENKINQQYYEKIINQMMIKFECIIIDLPSSPFFDIVPYCLEISTKILFVINPNYISIRQAVKYLGMITKLYKIPKGKIKVVVNKCCKQSLDMNMIKSLLPEYEIEAQIPYEPQLESHINGNKDYLFEYNKTEKVKKERSLIKEKMMKLIGRNAT